MKKLKFIILGTVVTDRASGITGTVTHWFYDIQGNVQYQFQPPGTNPETGGAAKPIMVVENQLVIPHNGFEELSVPVNILGSEVCVISSFVRSSTDQPEPEGIVGMALSFVRHRNGCLHVNLRRSGIHLKTKSPYEIHNYDIRDLGGDEIPRLTPDEIRASQAANPSPSETVFDERTC